VNIAGSLQLGLIYALLALGVFISFRIMNTPDLTADGSFTLGICISAVCTIAGHPLLAIPAGLIAGAAAGVVTGLLQTKGGIHPILAGILTMTALYSINIFVMGGSPNLSLLGKPTMFTLLQGAMNLQDRNTARHILILFFSFSSVVIPACFFKTSLGLQIRATGNAGKSTLFNVIAGATLPDKGQIILVGEDITWRQERLRARNIGRLFRDPIQGTAPDLTIEENLALVYSRVVRRFPLALPIGLKERKIFVEHLAKLDMGLETRLKAPVGTLSGGQRQALTLLLATLVPPKLLLLDEHTAALDPIAAKKILALTVEITGVHNITTLMITHNILSALETGRRTIMMHKGRIVMDLRGKEREQMTVEELERYREQVQETLDTDRLLF